MGTDIAQIRTTSEPAYKIFIGCAVELAGQLLLILNFQIIVKIGKHAKGEKLTNDPYWENTAIVFQMVLYEKCLLVADDFPVDIGFELFVVVLFGEILRI